MIARGAVEKDEKKLAASAPEKPRGPKNSLLMPGAAHAELLRLPSASRLQRAIA